MSTNEDVRNAREAYLAEHPFDPKKNAVMGHDKDGMPAGFLTLPDIGEVGILGVKLAAEYVAICHDEDLVEEWIGTVLRLAGSPDMTGILLANVFRGMQEMLAMHFHAAGPNPAYADVAADVWSKHFGGKS